MPRDCRQCNPKHTTCAICYRRRHLTVSDPIASTTGVVVTIEALLGVGGALVAIVGVYIALMRRVEANASSCTAAVALGGRVKALETLAGGITPLTSTVSSQADDVAKLRKDVDRLKIEEAHRRGREEVSGVRDVPSRHTRPRDSSSPHR